MLSAFSIRNAIRKSRMSWEVAACLTRSIARLRRLLASSRLIESLRPSFVEVCDNAGDDDGDDDIAWPVLWASRTAHGGQVIGCKQQPGFWWRRNSFLPSATESCPATGPRMWASQAGARGAAPASRALTAGLHGESDGIPLCAGVPAMYVRWPFQGFHLHLEV